MKNLCLGLLAAVTVAACEPALEGAGSTIAPQIYEDPTAVLDLHRNLMVFDAHLDTPARFHAESYDFSARSHWFDDGTQVDLPRMKDGGLDGGFWVIYIPQGPLNEASYQIVRDTAFLRQMSIREVASAYRDEIELAFSADQAEAIHESGKRVMLQSMENAYPLGEDLSLLRTFYHGGLRMIGLVHFQNNQFADSATDVSEAYGGLSALGEELVAESNRLGLIIDASHASDQALRETLALSTTPIVLSHSGANAVYDHPRNVPDDLLLDIAEAGGVIHMNAFSQYLAPLESTPGRATAQGGLRLKFGASVMDMTPEVRKQYYYERQLVDQKYPPPRATFDQFMAHVLHVLDLVGPDHVGIGADWDGGGGVEDMMDVSELPKITEALLEAGYSLEDLQKIWGGNLMRVLREVEAAASEEVFSPPMVN